MVNLSLTKCNVIHGKLWNSLFLMEIEFHYLLIKPFNYFAP